jgi:hypothetical protein
MASYEDSNWGFFVEIDNDSEHFRKYSSHYYNEWRKYNLETIEEGEYEDYDYALELYSNNDNNVCLYKNSKSQTQPQTQTQTQTKDTADKPINCVKSFIPYFCIIITLMYFNIL